VLLYLTTKRVFESFGGGGNFPVARSHGCGPGIIGSSRYQEIVTLSVSHR